MKQLKRSALLVFCLFLGCVFTVEAQKVNFGIKGGVNFSNFNDENFNDLVQDPNIDLDSSSGLLIGGFLNISSGLFSIQPEVLYNQKGAEFAGGSVTLDYLEIPLLLKFSFLPGPVQPNFFAGPYVGFVLDSKAQIAGLDLEFSNETQNDWGGILGVGVDFDLAGTEISVEGRYGWGFTNTYNFDIPFVEDVSLGSKNAVFSLVAGITL